MGGDRRQKVEAVLRRSKDSRGSATVRARRQPKPARGGWQHLRHCAAKHREGALCTEDAGGGELGPSHHPRRWLDQRPHQEDPQLPGARTCGPHEATPLALPTRC